MWFNNAQLFQFIDKPDYQADTLDTALEDMAFTPCGKQVPSSTGWEAPLRIPGAPLVHAAHGFLLMCLRVEEKVIPAAVIKEQLDEKIEEISNLEQRRVSRKEKLNLKDDIYQRLLPQAFCQSTRLYGYIDTKEGWLVVNTSSTKKAELFTLMLRKALGSLKIQLPQVHAPATVMSQWLNKRTLPDGFEFADYCVLQDLDEEQGTIRCQRQDLLSDDIHACLSEGRFVTELALNWLDQISVVINQDFSLRKIKFLDIIKEQAKETYTDTYQEQFDTDFALMSQTLQQLLRDLIKAFGTVASTATPALEETAAS